MENKKNSTILDVQNLKKYFPIRRGLFKRTIGWVRAVDGVNFQVTRGETVGLVGESGCGKTTVLKTLVGAIEPTEGAIRFYNGEESIDIAKADPRELIKIRKAIRMVFQDPESSLNPRMTVRQIVREPITINHTIKSNSKIETAVQELVQRVGLKPEHLNRYPYAFSGGQRQRIGIARSLALDPLLLLADEPTSALDVSVQAQILNLLFDLQRDMNLSIIFVTHDLSVIRHMADKIAVMYLGNIVEFGERAQIFEHPTHPYTEALLSSIPQPDPHRNIKRIELEGDIPPIASKPDGCSFHPRCSYIQERCKTEIPELIATRSSSKISTDHLSACHYSGELQLEGQDTFTDIT